MYLIKETNGTEHLSDNIIPIRVAANGSYVRDENHNDGFTAKIRASIEQPVMDDEGNETGEMETVETYIDQPFVLPGHTLKGGEPEATYTAFSGVDELSEYEAALEEAYKLLYG